MISRAIHNKVFEVTLALYRVTDFFPKEEAIRRDLRACANCVFQTIMEYEYQLSNSLEPQRAVSNLLVMKSMLELARPLQFVKSANMVVLEREYDALLSFFTREEKALQEREKNNLLALASEISKNETVSQEPRNSAQLAKKENPASAKKQNPVSIIFTERHKKVIEYVKRNPKAKISDIHAALPHVSTKTIQRTLQDLVETNMLEKEGEKRWTLYHIKDA